MKCIILAIISLRTSSIDSKGFSLFIFCWQLYICEGRNWVKTTMAALAATEKTQSCCWESILTSNHLCSCLLLFSRIMRRLPSLTLHTRPLLSDMEAIVWVWLKVDCICSSDLCWNIFVDRIIIMPDVRLPNLLEWILKLINLKKEDPMAILEHPHEPHNVCFNLFFYKCIFNNCLLRFHNLWEIQLEQL